MTCLDRSALPSPAAYFEQVFGSSVVGRRRNAIVRCVFHSDRSPSLSIDLCSGRFYCFGCGASGGDVIDFHRKLTGCSFSQAITDLSGCYLHTPMKTYSKAQTVEPNEWLKKVIHELWDRGTQAQGGDRVDRYMQNRGLQIARYPETLRFHSSVKYKHDDVDYGFFPTMLAKVENLSGEMVCVHRTYLSQTDNGKANVPKPKKLMPCAISGATKGAAIRLFPVARKLAVAEGIETALAFNQLTGIPSWATISAGGMEAIQLPDEVEEVIICVDLDQKGRGQRSADLLAKRLLQEGRKVFKAIPPGELLAGTKSKDWLDFLVERQASQIGCGGKNKHEQYQY